MSYYNNVMSLPLLALVCASSGELPVLRDLVANVSAHHVAIILFSGIVGFVFSTLGFLLNSMVSATSVMVANTFNKFAIILFSQLFERTIGALSWLGIAIAIFFVLLYSKTVDEASSQKLCEALARVKIVSVPVMLTCTVVFSFSMVWWEREQFWQAISGTQQIRPTQWKEDRINVFFKSMYDGTAWNSVIPAP
jgi:hypothetical protein